MYEKLQNKIQRSDELQIKAIMSPCWDTPSCFKITREKRQKAATQSVKSLSGRTKQETDSYSKHFSLLLYNTHNATQPVWQVLTFRSRVDDRILICAPRSTIFAWLPSQHTEDVYETEYTQTLIMLVNEVCRCLARSVQTGVSLISALVWW